MLTESVFTCEVCHSTDTDMKKIVECEAMHQKPVAIEDMSYSKKGVYPRSITISFPDGSKVTYCY